MSVKSIQNHGLTSAKDEYVLALVVVGSNGQILVALDQLGPEEGRGVGQTHPCGHDHVPAEKAQ